MPIIEGAKIFNDTYNNIINEIPIPVHLYYIHPWLLNPPHQFPSKLGLAPFTQAGQTMQMIYTPFLDFEEINFAKMQFDSTYYGPLQTDAGASQDPVYIYKIVGLAKQNTFTEFVKPIATSLPIYKSKQVLGIGNPVQRTERNYRFESKLQQSPYRYMQVQDFNATPLVLAPHLFNATDKSVNKFSVMVRTGINLNGGYTIYVTGYKNDTNGLSEGAVAEKGMDLPVSSSVFNDYMSRNKAQMIANTKISAIHGGIDAVEGGFNAMLGVATAGAGAYRQEITTYDKVMSGALDNPMRGREAGWTWMNRRDIAMGDFINNPHINYGTHNTSSGLANLGHGLTNMFASAYHLNAQMSDMFGAPRNVSMSSSDALFSIGKSNKKVLLQTYTITPYYRDKLCDFWNMYGYKVRRRIPLTKASLAKRRYFTFIKTVDLNIKGDDLDVNERELIKRIFNNGIRFWNYFNLRQDQIEMYNYDYENYEV